MQVADQDTCRSHMGKRVKIMAVPIEKQREQSLQQSIRIQELAEEHP